jgi:prophage antirepressor-like protein
MDKIFEIFNMLDKNYIAYGKSKIHVIIDSNDEVWFNAKQVALILEYKDTKNAIRTNVDSDDTIQLKHINYFDDDNNNHPNSIYLSEAGLYSLLISSKMPEAKKFKHWITHQVLPSIRKYGYYKLKKNTDLAINNLMDEINYLLDVNKKVKQDLKKNKFPKGGIVYAIDYSTKYEEIYRIGMTFNMKLRKKIYDTHTLHNHKVVMIKETKCPIRLESCLKAMLYDFRYGNKKDFYVCQLKKIKLSVNKCSKSLECVDNLECTNNQKGGSKSVYTKYNRANLFTNKLFLLKKKQNMLKKKSDLLDKIILSNKKFIIEMT